MITDDEIFLEPYHMADTDELQKCFPENFTDSDVCCGGRVPIIVAKKKTFLYESLSNYFDWLWIHNDQIIFGNKYKDLFNVECFDDIKTISKGRDEG